MNHHRQDHHRDWILPSPVSCHCRPGASAPHRHLRLTQVRRRAGEPSREEGHHQVHPAGSGIPAVAVGGRGHGNNGCGALSSSTPWGG